MSPYMGSLLDALKPHLRMNRKNIEVTVDVLHALSELSLIGGLEITLIVQEIFPKLIFYLQDTTNLNRREVKIYLKLF